jgi:hypothetical protein
MRRPIIVTRADGEVFTYPSIRAVLLDLELHPPSVHRALKHRNPMNKGPYRGWIFRYADSPVISGEAAPVIPQEFARFPKSRHEALQLGATHYFTGYACKHGHVALRKAQGACTECIRETWETSKISRKGYFEEYRKRPEVIARAKVYYENQKSAKPAGNIPPVAKPTYMELIEQARVKPRE